MTKHTTHGEKDGAGGKHAPAHVTSDAVAEAAAPVAVDVGRETLEETPERLLKFLRGVGTRPPIASALGALGYDEEEHARGWTLLHACSGFKSVGAPAPVVNHAVVEAINRLDAQDERTFEIIDATLAHRAPAVRGALLNGIEPGEGAESVVFFETLLGRMESLRKNKLVDVPAAQATKAVSVLDKRGLGEAWIAEMRGLVKQAEQYVAPAAPAPPSTQGTMHDHLAAARAYYEEWSRIAHQELKRKDYLIVLGLATRKLHPNPAASGAPAPSTASSATAATVQKGTRAG